MCYVGKATKIFIFIVSVVVMIGLVVGFSLFQHGLHKAHKCENGCRPIFPQSAPIIASAPPPYSPPATPTPPFPQSPPTIASAPPPYLPPATPTPPFPQSPPTIASAPPPYTPPATPALVTPGPVHA